MTAKFQSDFQICKFLKDDAIFKEKHFQVKTHNGLIFMLTDCLSSFCNTSLFARHRVMGKLNAASDL